MSKLTKILCLLCMAASLSAQKVKIKDFNVDANYQKLPAIGFATDVTTYDVNLSINEDKINELGYTKTQIKKKFNIGGYTKVDGGGKVAYIVKIGIPIISSKKLNKIENTNKDKTKYTTYTYSQEISINSSFKIIDNKGNLLSEGLSNKVKKMTSDAYKTKAGLDTDYRNSFKKEVFKSRGPILMESITAINTDVNSKFGVVAKKYRDEFESLSKKDHPEYESYEKIKPIVENAFKQMTVKDNSAFVKAIQPALDFWLEKEPGYDGGDKGQKKLKYACQYNAALAYFWMEDLANAKKYSNMVINGDYNEKKGKRILERVLNLEAKFKRMNRTSRHFEIKLSEEDAAIKETFKADREAAYASGDIQKFPEFESTLNVDSDSKVYPGSLTFKDGVREEGYFVYEAEDFTPDFREPSKIRFGKDDNGKIQLIRLDYGSLESIQISDQPYFIADVTLGGLFKVNNCIIEVIQPYEKTDLVLVHPPAKRSRINQEVMVDMLMVFHNEKERFIMTDGLLGFNNQMKKIVDGCEPALTYLAENKDAKKKEGLLKRLEGFDNSTTILEVLKIYDECK